MKSTILAALTLGLFVLLACNLPATANPPAAANAAPPAAAQDAKPTEWVVYPGGAGIGAGKHIVLVSGDEEYRSEEALPQLGKILSKHHGFKCTVLFAIDKDGTINPGRTDNIPGLEALKTADLMVIFTRFRNLPDDQMKHIADYLDTGKPVVGLRTATHAFNLDKKSGYPRFDWRSNGDWKGGFGRHILGETWIAHHGNHGSEATRGLLAKGQESHPILRGIKDGDIFGPTDVYTVKLPLPEDSLPLVMGQVVAGMKFDDKPVAGKKNDPMMPVAWTKSYKTESGKTGRAFTTTMGASQDMIHAGTRRMLLNGCLWALRIEEKITPDLNVEIVGPFTPLPFKFNGHKKGLKPVDHAME